MEQTVNGQARYRRILLKLSGEALSAGEGGIVNETFVREIATQLKRCMALGVQIGIIVGAGNIWRGVMGANTGMDPVNCDYMGMMATMMNALCIKEFCTAANLEAKVYGATAFGTVVPQFNREQAIKDLEAGKIVIFAGGTGSPFFTTDTTAALRALETQCDAVLKATKVDGIYTADPFKDPNAVRYKVLTFEEALSQQLKVMDAAAFSLCRDHDLPIVVFNFFEAGSMERVISGDTSAGTVVR